MSPARRRKTKKTAATLNLAQRAREAVDMTQREFAELVGVSTLSVSRWETGSVAPKGPAQALLRLLAAIPGDVVAVLVRELPERQRRNS